jgi:hypothetical protein
LPLLDGTSARLVASPRGWSRLVAVLGPHFRSDLEGRALHDSLHVIALRSSLVATRVVRDSRLVEVIERHPSLVGQAHGSGAPLFTTPTGLSPELEARYRAGAERLLATYHELLPRVAELMRGRARRDGADELELARCDARAAELLRGLLPAGVTTRFGFTAGGKALRRLVRKLLSHSLGEVRALGDSIRRATAALSPRIADAVLLVRASARPRACTPSRTSS